MKITFDIDGTLTNFEKFILDNQNYITKKYNIKLTNYDGYDIDEMYEIKNKLIEQNYTEKEAENKANEIMNKFWNKFYLKYLLTPFRKGVKNTLNSLKKYGNEVIIITSRRKACDKNLIGFFVRMSTILKFRLSNVKYSKLIFTNSDEEKIEQLKNIKPDIHIDDKESIINSLPSDIKCMYISSSYNKNIDEKKAVKVDTYENWNLINKIDKISVDKKVENVVTYPNIKNTEFNYKLVKSIGTPFVKFLYKPIILNKQNLVSDGPVVYASNHRKTLDPFFLVMSVDDAIHWAALRRFFTGEDSIFNNSKNPILCKITSKLFHGMGLIPVNRGGDNHEMIDLTNYYLKNGSNIGIFPEGTTNKNPANREILEVKNGAFRFAKDNNALIQPISIVWFPKLKKIKHRVIINYGVPFTMSNITIEEGKKIWTDSVLKGIEENKQIIDNVVDSEKRIKR